MSYYGSYLALADVDPNNSYGWKLSFRRGGVYSFIIRLVGAPHLGARIRHRILAEILKKPAKKESVLDVGAGFGLESLFLAQNGYKVFGIDKSKEKIKIAKKLASELGEIKAKFETADIFKFHKKTQFENVILFEVLEHVKNPRQMLLKISKFVRKGGRLIISFPSRHRLNAVSKEYLGHKEVGYEPKEIKKMLSGSGLKIRKKYTFGNSRFAKAFFYVDYLLLRYFPLASAAFFFVSYPVAILDQKLFVSPKPVGYVLKLKKI